VDDSDLVLGINAYTDSTDPYEVLSIVSESPENGELTPTQSITINFDDNITSGIDFSKISLKNEIGWEVNKSVTISGKSLIIKESPQNRVNGRLNLFIPKNAVKNSKDKYMSTDYKREFAVYAEASTIITFKDANLERLIRESLNKPTGNITAGEMRTIEALDGGGLDIVDLSGLEYAARIRRLDLYDNNIVSLEPIRTLLDLTDLDISYNKVKDIYPLKSLWSMEKLDISNNQIHDIFPLTYLSNLQILWMEYNYISDISPIKNLYNLFSLDISNNFLQDISTLETMAAGNVSDFFNIYLQKNYIDFSQNSDASNTLLVLDSYGVSYYGKDNQKLGLEANYFNNNWYYPGMNMYISKGEKLVIEFDNPITLSANTANLITLKGKTTGTAYKIGIEVMDNKLIITPLESITRDAQLTLNIQPAAVLCKYNTGISSNSTNAEILFDGSLYGDLDYNNTVDLTDLSILSESYNYTEESSENWNPALDLNYDGIIDIFDIVIVSVNI
jgi:Leucine-rich repeat (LRR) protein